MFVMPNQFWKFSGEQFLQTFRELLEVCSSIQAIFSYGLGFTASPLTSDLYDQNRCVNMQPWLYDQTDRHTYIPIVLKLPKCTPLPNYFSSANTDFVTTPVMSSMLSGH